MGNTFKTIALLTAMTVLLVLVGEWIFGGRNGLFMGLAVAGVMNFISYFFSDKIALAMYGAKQVTREELPNVYNTVERLAMQTGMPMPKVYLIPSESPNAFATGRNPKHASVAVTQGILRILDQQELEGVLAHELGHVKNRDILIGTVAATIAGAITMIARMGFWFGGSRDDNRGGANPIFALAAMILAPLAAMMIQMAVSRSREFAADATGAQITGNPYALASALRKLELYSRRVPLPANPATAHMFIIKPFLSGRDFASLFSTHPKTADRIARLTGQPDYTV